MTSAFAERTLSHVSGSQRAEPTAASTADFACWTRPWAPAEALLRHTRVRSGLPHLLPSLWAKANSSQDWPQGLPPPWVNSKLLVFSWAVGYSATHPRVLSWQGTGCPSFLPGCARYSKYWDKKIKQLFPCFLSTNLPSSSPPSLHSFLHLAAGQAIHHPLKTTAARSAPQHPSTISLSKTFFPHSQYSPPTRGGPFLQKTAQQT